MELHSDFGRDGVAVDLLGFARLAPTSISVSHWVARKCNTDLLVLRHILAQVRLSFKNTARRRYLRSDRDGPSTVKIMLKDCFLQLDHSFDAMI